MTDDRSKSPSTRQLVIGSAVAALVAAVALLLFVLPAEFGIDPTGVGKALGVAEISGSGEMTEAQRGALRKGVLTLTDKPMRNDHWEVELQPFEAIEFKYTLAEGTPMAFSWQATGKLNYDMHAHPFEGGEALTESYGKDAANGMRGTYVAPFTGIHGWYWQNRTMDPVKLTLEATGGFTASTLFDQIGQHDRPIGTAR